MSDTFVRRPSCRRAPLPVSAPGAAIAPPLVDDGTALGDFLEWLDERTAAPFCEGHDERGAECERVAAWHAAAACGCRVLFCEEHRTMVLNLLAGWPRLLCERHGRTRVAPVEWYKL